MTLLLLTIAIFLSAIAAFYAVSGLVAIFSAAAIPIAIMGGGLEVAKLVVASWLYRRWKDVNFLMKTYFAVSLIVLMLLTSMGIFGFLSKAHIEQRGVSGTTDLQVVQIDNNIAREQKKIKDAELVISQLDKTVQILLDNDRVRGNSGAVATRQNQKEERDSLQAIIDSATNKIVELENTKQPLLQSQLAQELEIGPLKYVAELIYGDDAKSHFDEAVRWVIIAIIFVFDPLAVMLLIAWNKEMGMRVTPIAPVTPTHNPPKRREPEVKKPEPKKEEVLNTSEPVKETWDSFFTESVENMPWHDKESEEAKKRRESDIYNKISRPTDSRPNKFQDRE